MIKVVTHEPQALEKLRIAFRACPADFEALQHEIETGRVSLYELWGDKYSVTVAGEVIGENYFLWGVAGQGIVPAIRELSHIVKRAGLSGISAETYFPALVRLVTKLNLSTSPSGDITELMMKV